MRGKKSSGGQSKVSERGWRGRNVGSGGESRGWRGRNVGSGGESRGYAEEKNE